MASKRGKFTSQNSKSTGIWLVDHHQVQALAVLTNLAPAPLPKPSGFLQLQAFYGLQGCVIFTVSVQGCFHSFFFFSCTDLADKVELFVTLGLFLLYYFLSCFHCFGQPVCQLAPHCYTNNITTA